MLYGDALDLQFMINLLKSTCPLWRGGQSSRLWYHKPRFESQAGQLVRSPLSCSCYLLEWLINGYQEKVNIGNPNVTLTPYLRAVRANVSKMSTATAHSCSVCSHFNFTLRALACFQLMVSSNHAVPLLATWITIKEVPSPGDAVIYFILQNQNKSDCLKSNVQT